jgi:ATP-binding cassette subfamily B protein
VVQDGLSQSVSAFVKAFCTIIGMIVIMFTYSWKLTLYALLLISPSIFSNRIFMNFYRKYNEAYQKAKGEMMAVAQETFANVRTVKAFADEKGSIKSFQKQNASVYHIGKIKSIVWGGFMFTYKVFQ